MILRRAGLYDMAPLARLHHDTVRRTLPFLPELHTAEDEEIHFRTKLFDEHEIWVAEEGRALLGYVAFRFGFVQHLFLDADHLRQGIGTALLDIAKERYAELGLWTFQQNTRARAFYERHGFKAVTFTEGEDNEEKTPDVFYAWKRSEAAPTA